MMATYSEVPKELEDQYEVDSYDDSKIQKKINKLDSFEESFPALPSAGKSIKNKVQKSFKPAFVSENIVENFSIPAYELKKEVIGGSKTSEVCKKVRKNIPVQIDVSIQSKTGTVTIILKGKEVDVKAAKREICSGICTEVIEQFPFPLSARKFILGQQGNTIKSIMTETKTNIDMPPRPANESELDEDEEQVLEITGDRDGVELAKEEIEKIINKHANRFRLTINVPRSYHIFIAGIDNCNLKLIQTETGARVRIPPYIVSEKVGNPEEIVITGTKAAATNAYEKIEAIYKELKHKTDKLVFTCNKKQFPFIVGPRGKNLQEILQQTGCSVELPLPKDKSDQITIRGPPERLPIALKLVTEKANSQFVEDVKLNNILAKPSDVRFLRKYIYTNEWQKVKDLEKKLDVVVDIRESRNSGDAFEVTGKVKTSVEKAAKEFTDMLKKCKTYTYDIIEIPHGIHSHILGKNAKNLNKIKAKYDEKLVDIIIPIEKEESDEIVIVIDSKNTASTTVTSLLEQVKQDIKETADRFANIVTQTVDIDSKYHRYLIGQGGSAIKQLKAKYNNNIIIRFPQKDEKVNNSIITLTGPQKDVLDAINEMKSTVESQKHIDFMNKFTDTVTVGKGIGRRVVGNGNHVQNWLSDGLKKKLEGKQEVTDEELNLLRFEIKDDGEKDVITCIGHRNLIPTVIELLAERSKEIEDTVVEDLDILNQYHSVLIGQKGKNINEIKRKYGVQFFFPEKIDPNDEDYEEKSKSKEHNKVTIRGLRNDVEKAKKVVLKQVQDIIDHSHEVTFKVPNLVISKIVGRKGVIINKIKKDTDTRIDFDEENVEGDEEEVPIVIRGTKKGCDDAKKQIMKIVKESPIILSRDVNVPRDIHRALNTRFRSHMDALINKYSVGNEKVRLNFPYGFEDQDELNNVVLRAPKETIDDACEAFTKLVEKVIEDVKNRVSLEIKVPRRDLARIVGSKGSHINEISKKYDVSIDMNRENTDDADMVPITISGLDMEKIEGAKKDILASTTTYISIPVTHIQSQYLNLSLQNNQRRQGNTFVDFTDDSVVIHGEKKICEGFKKNIDEKLEEIADYTYSKEFKVDSSACSLIIGRAGANINRIRKETQCMIYVSAQKNYGEENKDSDILILAKDEESLNRGFKAINNITSRVTLKTSIPNYLHGRIIGQKGKNLEAIKKACGRSIRINFPPRNSKSDNIDVTGERKEVEKCIELLKKQAEEIRKELGEDEDWDEDADEEEENSQKEEINVQSNQSSRTQRYIPGYSGEKKVNVLKSSDVMLEDLNSAMSYLGVQNYQKSGNKKEEDEWQVIENKKNKNKNGTTEEESEAAVESSASKKKKNKKKNKKKKAAAALKEQEEAEEAERLAREEAERIAKEEAERAAKEEAERVAREAAAAAEDEEQAQKKKKKNKKNKKKKAASAANQESVEQEEVKVENTVVEPEVNDDEWISIPKKQTKKKNTDQNNGNMAAEQSVNAFANLNEDNGEKKKKKKNKKKKNTSNQ